jgi:hypothetical protein
MLSNPIFALNVVTLRLAAAQAMKSDKASVARPLRLLCASATCTKVSELVFGELKIGQFGLSLVHTKATYVPLFQSLPYWHPHGRSNTG